MANATGFFVQKANLRNGTLTLSRLHAIVAFVGGPVAQLDRAWASIPRVAGSNPARLATICSFYISFRTPRWTRSSTVELAAHNGLVVGSNPAGSTNPLSEDKGWFYFAGFEWEEGRRNGSFSALEVLKPQGFKAQELRQLAERRAVRFLPGPPTPHLRTRGFCVILFLSMNPVRDHGHRKTNTGMSLYSVKFYKHNLGRNGQLTVTCLVTG